jgi:DNA gyrase subunit B
MITEKEYNAKDIKTLSDIESVQVNPDQYIGSTETPTHLIEEALDNALDEAQTGNVSIIAINIDTKNNIFSIIDNGRGIPLTDNVPKLISTKLHSGAKFRGSKTAYEISSGLHGVGLVTLAALSDFYTIEIYRDGKCGKWEFEHSKLKRNKIIPFTDKKPFSTMIKFKPSKKYFETLTPNINRIKRRLTIASAELSQNMSFILNIDGEQEILKLSLMDYFKTSCIGTNEEFGKVSYFKTSDPPEEFNVILTYVKTGSVTPKSLSSVNLLPVDDGGTHINILYEILRDLFVEKGKKLEYNFQPTDTLVGLRAYLMLSLKEPRFGGQTKSKLTNRKTDFEHFNKNLRKQLDVYFVKHKEHLHELLQQFHDYRQKMDAKKIKPKTNSRASTKFTKLRDCTSKLGELFIAEGESASGGLVDCRDPRKHAILPLRGKIPSAATKKEILKNKEILELIMSLGTGYGPNFDLRRLKYSKIICATDADEDGLHIFCLLTLALAVLVPEVIKSGHYFYAQTPLYAINEKNNFIPLWTEEEVSKAKSENRKLIRAKGLGELNPNQLKKVLIDNTRRLIPVTFTKDLNKIIKLFTDSNEKRKLLKGEWVI